SVILAWRFNVIRISLANTIFFARFFLISSTARTTVCFHCSEQQHGLQRFYLLDTLLYFSGTKVCFRLLLFYERYFLRHLLDNNNHYMLKNNVPHYSQSLL